MQPSKKVITNDPNNNETIVEEMIVEEMPPAEIQKTRTRSNSVGKKSHALFKRTPSSSEKEPAVHIPIKPMPTIELKNPPNVEKMVEDVKDRKMRVRSLSIGSSHSNVKVSKAPTQQVKSEKLPTCESIINSNFTLISEEIIRKMIPKERVSLQKALQNTQTKAKEHNRDELCTRTARGLEYIATIQEELRNALLINLIERNANDLWSALFLAGETIIPCKKLFSLISCQIEILTKEFSPRMKIVLFQLFCTNWLEINKGSLLVKQAQQEIEAIINLTINSQENSISRQSQKLQTTLQAALTELPITTKMVTHLSHKYINFSSVLEMVRTQSETLFSYDQAVKMVADDLQYKQCELYCNIAPKDFFPECYDPQPLTIIMYTQLLNQLSDFVIDTILQETDFHLRVRLLKFFIDVCKACMERNDYTSSAAIGACFGNGAFSKIPNTFATVAGSEKHKLALELFNNLFTGSYNYGALRERMDNLQTSECAYIPYTGLYSKDITLSRECDALTCTPNEDPMYNIERITIVNEMIKKALAAQKRWKRPDIIGAKLTTNFITHYLATHQAIDNDTRSALAAKLIDL